jgi:hypothetical protein
MAKSKAARQVAYAKIYPPIGIARVGDSEDTFFFGPEFEPGGLKAGETYRDASGRLKRQAARFRLYGFDSAGACLGEITADQAEITWTAHLANKKAAWFAFSGTNDANKHFKASDEALEMPLRNRRIGKIVRDATTGALVSDEDRKSLEIDPGPRSVSGVNKSPATGKTGNHLRFLGLFKAAPATDPDGYEGHEVYLGELRTDEKGRLVVLGGRGLSQPVGPNGPANGEERLNYWIVNYANNDHWYDDTSDGPVSATVKIDGQSIDVRGGAWVVVAPPDFAPDIENLVTLYDVMEEVALGAKLATDAGTPRLRAPDNVGFHQDIEPVLNRANAMRWVSPLGLRGHGYAKPGVLEGEEALSQAVSSDEGGKALRERFVRTVRAPNYEGVDPISGQWTVPDAAATASQAVAFFMPPLSGDEGDRTPGDSTTWLSLTRLQYLRMQAWGAGQFDSDDVAPAEDEPAGLTRHTLQAACGGAFFPGIEVTSIVRQPSLYSEAFRFDPRKMGAGDLTKYMACPWQADFYECRDAWWPAQRPDETITDEAFEELFASFEEERKTSVEAVLFRRERWDRGLDQKPRPSSAWLLDRLLPEPDSTDADAYLARVATSAARALMSLTPAPAFYTYADGNEALVAGVNAERLPHPWRLQFIVQEQLDRYAGRYFLPTVPEPEAYFSSRGISTQKTSWEELLDLFPGVTYGNTLAEARRNWKVLTLSHPAFVGRLVGMYVQAIYDAVFAYVREVAGSTPPPEGDPADHQQPDPARQIRYNLRQASADPRAVPKDFDEGSEEFLRLRGGEFVSQLLSWLFLRFSRQSPDMAMVDGWHELGIVRRKQIAEDASKGIAGGTVQIETEREKFGGRSYRDYFYYLMNIEKYPDFIPTARTIAHRILEAAQVLIDEVDLYDVAHPESYVPYSAENFTAKLEQIYEILRSDADTAQQFIYNYTRSELIKTRVDRAPFNQTDGAWLRYAANAGTLDEVSSMLFEVWSDEVGNGDASLHHGNLYTSLLRSLGVYLPDVSSRAYADNPDIAEIDYVGAVFQLAISQHSEEFLPELIGMTLFLEWEVLSLVPGVRRMEYMGIDPQFWRMHVAIDNASNGHGAKAKQAVELYLDSISEDGGQAAAQEAWRRIWRGFVAFATAGYDLFQNRDSMTIEAESERHPPTPADRAIEVIERKRPYGNRNHLRHQLGMHRINDLFDTPELFLDELAHSPWVVPGEPDQSRLITYLTTFQGTMYKVFDANDLAVWRDWITWLGREGDTPRPKRHLTRAEAMKILLAEMRQQMLGSNGHRLYRVPSLANGPHLPRLVELFSSSDLDEIMKALRDPRNGWVVPFRPAESPLIFDLLRPGRPMGAALDRRFPQLFNEVGRMTIYEWIAAGCPLTGESPAPEEKYVVPKKRARRLFVQQVGMGAVH